MNEKTHWGTWLWTCARCGLHLWTWDAARKAQVCGCPKCGAKANGIKA